MTDRGWTPSFPRLEHTDKDERLSRLAVPRGAWPPIMIDLKESGGSEASAGSFQPSSWQIFAHRTTLHGLRFVFAYGPVTLRRILWAAAFLASLGLLALESAERLAYFFSHPHVTRVDAVVSSSLVFPVVTICNLNTYRFSKLTRNDLYHAGELLALLDVHLRIPDPHLADPEVLEFLTARANFTGYKPKPFNMKEFIERVGHDLKDMMLYCRYRGQECTIHDFKTSLVPSGGGGCGKPEPSLAGQSAGLEREGYTHWTGCQSTAGHPEQD
ncbi:hypothetical protein Z043_122782 [Scleropages formosus]|uniref:Acid-sensing ion channel 2-like n=1 Tax=Scleropages formosus TaxID=113540 RepID=A0A0P7TNJ3_SCLFO|nr:hypothetical protein Z043_122782 [Scleropages formosus]